MSQETKERARKAAANADESASEKGTNGVMLAMFVGTLLAVSSAVSIPNRQVETPASEATEQSLQQAQPSPLPVQSNNQALQQPIAQQSVQQSVQQPVQQPIQPSILPSEPINQNQVQSGNLPAQP